MIIDIDDRWRLSEDGTLQWILQYRAGKTWQNMSFCGTRDGLLGVAMPHRRITVPKCLLEALRGLPNRYEPGALDAVAEQMELMTRRAAL